MWRIKMTVLQIETIDQIQLKAEYFQADLPSEKIVLISPATGVKKHIYNQFAQFLNQHGFDVLTWDWRGIADNLKGDIKKVPYRMEDWAKKDLNAMILWATEKYPQEQIFAVGHSFGGQGLGLASDIHHVKAIVTVATQSGYWKHWPHNQRYQFATLWYGVMPVLSHAMGYFPAKKLGLGENLPKGVALQWASWGRNANYMTDYDGHAQMKQPILAYYMTDDLFAPQEAVKALHQHYHQCKIEYREVTPQELNVKSIGHFGFFKHIEAQKLWLEVIHFFNNS